MKRSNLTGCFCIDLNSANRILVFTLTLAFTLALAPPRATAALYSAGGDLQTDMGLATPVNPYGPWQYGGASSATGASFLHSPVFIIDPSTSMPSPNQGWYSYSAGPLTLVNVTNATENVPGPLSPGEAAMHPGPSVTNGYAEFLFTAPAAGLYTVNETFTALNFGTDDVHVVVNGTSVHDHFFSGAFPTSDSYSGTFPLTAGGTIAFTEGAYNSSMDTWSYNSNIMGLTATITPEPSSMALLGLAAAGLLVVARRRKA